MNAPQTDPNAVPVVPLKQALQQTQYMDGFGRPAQSVVKQGSLYGGNYVDFVSTNYYDAYGREQHRFLPFAANNAGGATAIADGSFKYNPGYQQDAFYTNANGNGPLNGQNEWWFYGSTVFDASPMNRPLHVRKPGNNWNGAEKGVGYYYGANTATDSVAMLNAVPVSGYNFYGFSKSQNYPAGELVKTITSDEQGGQVIEFKDKSGRIILKKTKLTADADLGSGSGHPGWICTYFVYSDASQLIAVIQPEGTD